MVFKEKYPMFKNENPGWVTLAIKGFRAFYWAFTELKYNDKIPFNLYLQVEAVSKTINDTIIALKIKLEDKEYRRYQKSCMERIEKSLDEKSKFSKT